MTHGVVAALLIAGLVAGRPNPWSELYDPARKPVSAAKEFVSENLTAVKNPAEYVAPGEIAAYRDQDGGLHLHSAKCTHLGCHVHWNSLETCWDCPCHGSQFGTDGAVLQGPAIAPLEPFKP